MLAEIDQMIFADKRPISDWELVKGRKRCQGRAAFVGFGNRCEFFELNATDLGVCHLAPFQAGGGSMNANPSKAQSDSQIY